MKRDLYGEFMEIWAKAEESECECSSQGKTWNKRSYKFYLPNTSFLTYGMGVLDCTITSSTPSYFSDYTVSVYYGSIDDGSISFTCFCKNETDMNELYEVFKEELHLTDRGNPVGLMGVDHCDRFKREDFEAWINLIIDSNGFQSKTYAKFDYN